MKFKRMIVLSIIWMVLSIAVFVRYINLLSTPDLAALIVLSVLMLVTIVWAALEIKKDSIL
jgi:hypothetical protein